MVSELLFAAARNDITGIRQLIAKGVPVHAGNFDSRTALHLAAAEGNLETVKLLINYKHPINVRDRWKSTPLDEAKRENRISVYNFLKKLDILIENNISLDKKLKLEFEKEKLKDEKSINELKEFTN